MGGVFSRVPGGAVFCGMGVGCERVRAVEEVRGSEEAAWKERSAVAM